MLWLIFTKILEVVGSRNEIKTASLLFLCLLFLLVTHDGL